MKKLMVLVAVLAMMLVVAAPAFAQTNITVGDNVEYNAVAQNIAGEINTTAVQAGTANATAVGGGDAVAVATVDQTQDVSVEQSNVVGNGFFWWWWF